MDLILWRHADAEDWTDDSSDLTRVLTPRGLKQATRIATWLDRQLPEGTRVVCSPARRCDQTAAALGRKYKVRPELAPERTPAQLLEAALWPTSRGSLNGIGSAVNASRSAGRTGPRPATAARAAPTAHRRRRHGR